MKHIGLLLHFYQPPTQDPEVVKKIDLECYRPLFQLLLDTGVPVTINMNYSLTEQLAEFAPETLEIVAKLSEQTFTSSGAFHPIFPLIPEEEVQRQLLLNDLGNKKLIGKGYSPEGAFPPELAVDMKTIKLIGKLGYLWTVTDDVPWVFEHSEVPSKWIPSVDGTGVFLRSNFWSNLISFHGGSGDEMVTRMIDDLYEWSGEEDSYVILAMDGETFGHHRPGAIESFLTPFFSQLQKEENIKISSLETIFNEFPKRESFIPAGSWSTVPSDLKTEEPFPLWYHSLNENHITYWKLLNFVLQNVRKSSNTDVATSVDKMLYSCPMWWASPGRESFSQVRRGILLIIEAALGNITERVFLDQVMELAGQIPAMARKDKDA